MSTEIKVIKGREEYNEKYCPSELSITRFYAGKDIGRMLQLTINGNRLAHIQLTPHQIYDLGITLLKSFDDTLYPSE